LSQIDELLPEGIGEEDSKEKSKLSDLTESLSQSVTSSYSEGEEELTKISDQLTEITTTTDFFETEKLREKQRRDADKAQSLREAMAFGEKISTRDRNWLSRYDEAVATGQTEAFARGEFGKAYVEAKSTEVAAADDGRSEVADTTESTVADMNIDAITDSIEEETIAEDSIATAEVSDEDYHPDDDLALDFSDEDEEEALS
jgi:segregation and condensation protein B